LTGPEGGPACKVGVAVTDIATGLYVHGAVMAALFARTKTGRGQRIDTSLLECQIANLANIGSNVLLANTATKRWGTAHESIAPYQAFSTSDGDVIVAAMNDKQYATLCRVLGRLDLGSDER
jgi:succinate--hydroxymethylglutarate CoA-transferase